MECQKPLRESLGECVTLRITAQYASIWNFVGGTVAEFRHKNDILNQHCAAIGRDPAEIARSIQCRTNYENLAETAAGIRPYIEAGATHIALNLRAPYPEHIVQRLAEEIVEPLNGEYY